ncbi:MAG: hypothetical protein Q7T41_01150 [Candidatus Saccharibacteria bacterium]|nr:hypothetical protein [Candidatus Saccharibacteria bacterium]
MFLPEVEIPIEPISETDRYCATCPEMGSCAIVGGMMNLDEWNDKNPAVTEGIEYDGTSEYKGLRDLAGIRSSASELFVNLAELQVECVATMEAGGESLQHDANDLINNSVSGKYARKNKITS